ncbi:ribonuclease HII [Thermaurantimonas aggregans]|uniref:ribonuclease HII n=1 Tax=Thermaurantimonas aggregans TaxID=2173829 RepID=UPI0027D8D00E|nr:ribonuclease HII [Thermaurantimonas aggregans]
MPEAGCDETGRGCLAGPVVAAAVILDSQKPIPLLNDSKKLTARQRESLFDIICQQAKAWAIAEVSVEEINRINILNASLLAMQQAVLKLTVVPGLLLIDGNRFPRWHIPHRCMVKGDARYQAIAAASILAKVYRDRLMLQLHQDYPHFQWDKNKGYPTRPHIEALLRQGITPHHRRKFVSKFFEPDLFGG